MPDDTPARPGTEPPGVPDWLNLDATVSPDTRAALADALADLERFAPAAVDAAEKAWRALARSEADIDASGISADVDDVWRIVGRYTPANALGDLLHLLADAFGDTESGNVEAKFSKLRGALAAGQAATVVLDGDEIRP